MKSFFARFAVLSVVAAVGVSVASSALVLFPPITQSVQAANANITVAITQQAFLVRDNATARLVVDLSDSVGKVVASEGLALEVILHKRIESRRAFVEATDNGALPDPLDGLRLKSLELNRTDVGRFILDLPTTPKTSATDELFLGQSGIYPITVLALVDKMVAGEATTFIHHVSDADFEEITPDEKLAVVPVVSITGPPSTDISGASVVTDNIRSAVQLFIDSYTGGGAFVSLQPDYLRALAASPLATDLALLNSVRELVTDHTVASFPDIPINPSAAASAELGESFARHLRTGEDETAAIFGANPDRETFLVQDPLTTAGALLLRDLGVRNVVLTPRAQSDLKGELDSSLVYRTRLDDGSSLTVRGTDTRYANVLQKNTLSPLMRASQVAAELVLQRSDILRDGDDLSTRQVLVSFTNGVIENGATVRQLLRLVNANPLLSIASNPRISVIETAPDEISLSAATDTSLVATKGTINTLELRIKSIGSMLLADDPRLSRFAALLGVMPASTTTEDQRAAYAKAVTVGLNRIRNAVTLPKSANFTLSGRKSELRLQIKNASDTPLMVVVRFSSAKLTFPKNAQTVMLTPNGSTEISVNVVARSNGRFPVRVQLFTPQGNAALNSPVVITARVSALAGLGLVVSFTAVLVLLTWWVHNWRSKRRRALVAAGLLDDALN